ncbi:glycosyltransferase family 4 protein [Haliea sp. E17]|uniref:glycosyltransferase family 4 protein n=1 Tax=Haliea sp. E17 TaxID=3401576 RepID=UPI003AAAFC7D
MPRSIITISTKEPGGIRAVVENYQQSDVFSGYESYWLGSHQQGSLIFRIWTYVRCLCQVLCLRIQGHRLYHLHMAMNGSFFRKMILVFLLKLSRARVILHLHGSEFDYYHEHTSRPVKWLFRHTLKATDVVVVLSKKWQDTVTGIDTNIRSRVIYNYVEPVPKAPTIPTTTARNGDSKLVRYVYMGEVGQRKGIYDLLPAFAELRRVNANVELVVCGSGELDQARQTAQKCGLNGEVTFAGWISGTEKHAMLNSADVLVLPSYHEGLPMAILEAMSLGKCVIASTVGGIPEALAQGESGLLHGPGDLPALVELLTCATDARTRQTLGQNGRNSYFANFTPEIIVPQIREMYHELT